MVRKIADWRLKIADLIASQSTRLISIKTKRNKLRPATYNLNFESSAKHFMELIHKNKI